MPLSVAIQMDPPATLNPKGDTTLLLAAEAQARGHKLYYYHPSTLSLRHPDVTTTAFPFTVHEGKEVFFSLGAEAQLSLNTVDVVLMRQDPPFDMHYITACHFLELLPKHIRIANNPYYVRNLPEKIFPYELAEYMPPTIITRTEKEILSFLLEHGDSVLKPLYGYGGKSVFLLKKGDANIAALLEFLLNQSSEPVIVQKYLPEVKVGDCRMIFIHGNLSGVFARVPAEDAIRSNLRVGGTAKPHTMTKRQQQLADTLGPLLKERGLMIAGVDMIGDYLTEINITSPTGLRALKALYGTSPEKEFWDGIEKA